VPKVPWSSAKVLTTGVPAQARNGAPPDTPKHHDSLSRRRDDRPFAHPMVHSAAVVHQRNGGSTQMLPPKVTADYTPATETLTSPPALSPCCCSPQPAR